MTDDDRAGERPQLSPLWGSPIQPLDEHEQERMWVLRFTVDDLPAEQRAELDSLNERWRTVGGVNHPRTHALSPWGTPTVESARRLFAGLVLENGQVEVADIWGMREGDLFLLRTYCFDLLNQVAEENVRRAGRQPLPGLSLSGSYGIATPEYARRLFETLLLEDNHAVIADIEGVRDCDLDHIRAYCLDLVAQIGPELQERTTRLQCQEGEFGSPEIGC